MDEFETLKKKLLYRSSYRGTKEMDILLSSFVRFYINKLNKHELVDLDKFLGIDEDKTPTVFTPDQSLEDLLSSYTDVINLNRGGNVPNGTNLAIDKFLSSMM